MKFPFFKPKEKKEDKEKEFIEKRLGRIKDGAKKSGETDDVNGLVQGLAEGDG